MDYLIALGTHIPMDEAALNKLFGLTAEERVACASKAGKYAKVNIFNHAWEKPETFKQIGVITADEIEAITGGLMRMDVPVTINKKLWDYDQVIICGPTFRMRWWASPVENKYFFPASPGQRSSNSTFGLGAVITSWKVIARKSHRCAPSLTKRHPLLTSRNFALAW